MLNTKCGNLEKITKAEVEDLLIDFPVGIEDVDYFLLKEPDISELFSMYAEQYVKDFLRPLGIRFTKESRANLKNIIVSSLVLGFLTKENMFLMATAKALGKQDGKDVTSTTDNISGDVSK
jgi:hypothetical protein